MRRPPHWYVLLFANFWLQLLVYYPGGLLLHTILSQRTADPGRTYGHDFIQ